MGLSSGWRRSALAVVAFVGCGRAGYEEGVAFAPQDCEAGCAASEICTPAGCAPEGSPDFVCARDAPLALFCDDFAGDLSAWQDIRGDVAQGAGWLRVGYAGSFQAASHTLAQPVREGTLHLGSSLYVPAGAAPNEFLVALIADGRDLDGRYTKISLDLFREQRVNLVSTFNGGSGALSARGAWTAGRWLCVELRISLGEQGVVELWIDGTRVVQTAVVDTLPDSGYTTVRAGGSRGNEPDVLSLYFGHLVASLTAPVCPGR